ncbi:MAG: hypothetical protein GY716_16465 [bacterium]|nr:hypothetical protein [bacterium]
MSRARHQAGISLIELMVSLTVFLLALTGVAALLVQNARVNKSQQLVAEMQSNARTCLSMIVQRLRSAGWDPVGVGVTPVTLDPNDVDGNDADGVDEIDVFADFDEDGVTTSDQEEIRIRRIGSQVEWRTTSAGSFSVLALNVTNDADGDGTPEPMFLPDAVPSPTRMTVQITTRSIAPDPVTGDYLRYTLSSDVALRTSL